MAGKRRSPEIIAGRVNADGSIATGDGFTVTKGSTGLYTITLGAGFRHIAATASGAAGVTGAIVTQATDRSFVVSLSTTTTGASVDQAFTFVAAGVQQ